MPGSLPFRLNRSGMLLALISAGFAGEAGAAAGRVDFTTAGVTVASRDGQARPLAKGTELDNGDTVRTSNEGRAQIRFSDGSYVSLQPNTDFAISDYKFEGKDDDRGFFGLVKGAMRTVTGAVGRVNRNSYRITTPTATVGIRGTGGVVQVLNDGSTLVIGTSGIWSLTNPAGSIDIPAGVSGLAPTEPNTPPKETNTQPQTKPVEVEVKPVYTQGDQVTSTGAADIGTLIKPLVSGSGYAFGLAYGTLGNGTQLDGGEFAGTAAATFNELGQLTKIVTNFVTSTLLPGGTHAEFASDGILAWGRWVGPVDHTCGECATTYNANQGFHYVVGMPTVEMPIGGAPATYNLFAVAGAPMNGLSATSPTYRDGSTSPGTFEGSLLVNFRPVATGTHSITGNFKVTMPDQVWSWSSSASTSTAQFNMSTGTVSGCNSSCSAGVAGFFAGANAERAGIAYHVSGYSVNTSQFKDVVGAAALKKQ